MIIIAIIIIIIVLYKKKKNEEESSAETESIEIPEEDVLIMANGNDFNYETITVDLDTTQYNESDPFNMDFEENYV